MQVILHHRSAIDSPGDVGAGRAVFVPHYDASRGRNLIRKRTDMMIRARSWDHRGQLYEAEDDPELELNPGLDDGDLDHRNLDYHFLLLDQR